MVGLKIAQDTLRLSSTALLGCQEDSQPFSHREGRGGGGGGAVPGRWLCGTPAGQLGLKGGGGGAVQSCQGAARRK